MTILTSAFNKLRKQAGLPPVPKDATPEQRQFFQAIRENLAVRMGQEGDPLEKAVTFKDMGRAGMLKGSVSAGGFSSDYEIVPPGGGDTGPPPLLTGLTVNSGFEMILLSWDVVKLNYSYYIEVWRSTVDLLDLSSPDMKLIGSANAHLYVDNLASDTTTYYYWVRVVKVVGSQLVYGPFNATAGTPGQIVADYETVRDYLTATDWQANTAYGPLESVVPTTEVIVEGVAIRLLATVSGTSGAIEPDWATLVTAIGDTVADGTVTWEAVEAGKIPFYIDPATGLVVIDGASFREASVDSLAVKNLSADKLYAESGTLAEVIIGEAHITDLMLDNILQSNNYSATLPDGWIIYKNGYAEFHNVTVRGHLEATTGRINDNVIVGAGSYSAAQLIADAQASGDAATRVAEWTRPTTTLINGNKIFTGDAYVDTLQIKGQAVTFPRGVHTAAGVSPATGWNNIQSLTATLTGAPIIIMVSFAAFESLVNNDVFVNLRILIGGSIVHPSQTVCRAIQDGENAQFLPEFVIAGSPGVIHYVSAPGAGTKTIEVQCDSNDAGITYSNRSLVVLEAKR